MKKKIMKKKVSIRNIQNQKKERMRVNIVKRVKNFMIVVMMAKVKKKVNLY